MNENRKLEGYEEEADDRTAIVNLKDLKAPRKQSKDRHLLVRVRGAELGRVTLLSPERVRVGRSHDSELWLSDDGVSRRHANLQRVGNTYVLEDESSANGTFVGGVKITRHELRDGDVIQFGPTAVFRYTLSDESQESLLRQLYDASVTDALTGAHNREHFDTQLRAELSYARRHNTDVSLVIFDADHFKKVNDTYGHQVGDNVLMQIANVVRGTVRSEDVFARYGGEEFALVLRGIDIEGCGAVADRLRERIAAVKIQTERGTLSITVSAGCASLSTTDDKTPEGMIAVADRRLYGAKHAGRNRVMITG
ncbi:MAG TPA: GGDEF domain-containing protein [Polyangiaceae bacterium]|nr:GGDEF domain-containing protein [Polyangiaceae bacterium]